MDKDAICIETATPAGRRYMRDMGIAGVLYAAITLVATAALNRLEPALPLRILLALAPVVPALLMLRAYVIFFRAMDEFHRRVQGEAILIAAGLVGFGSLGYGFLEAFADAPRIGFIWVLPAMIILFGLAQPFVAKRYR